MPAGEARRVLIERGYEAKDGGRFTTADSNLEVTWKRGRVAMVRGYPHRLQVERQQIWFPTADMAEVRKTLGEPSQDFGPCHCFRTWRWRNCSLAVGFEGDKANGVSCDD